MPEIVIDVFPGRGMYDPCVTCAIFLLKRIVCGLPVSWRTQRELAEAQTQLCWPRHQLVTESAAR